MGRVWGDLCDERTGGLPISQGYTIMSSQSRTDACILIYPRVAVEGKHAKGDSEGYEDDMRLTYFCRSPALITWHFTACIVCVKRRNLSKSLHALVTANENELFTSAYGSKGGLRYSFLRAGVRIPQRQRHRCNSNQPRLIVRCSLGCEECSYRITFASAKATATPIRICRIPCGL